MTQLATEIRETVRLKDDEGLSFAQIGDKLGFSERTAGRRYQAGLVAGVVDGLILDDELLEFPAVEIPEINANGDFIPEDKEAIARFKPLTCVGDAMLTADYHIPLHDPGLINAMINCARENGIKRLVIGGDYFNMEDFSSYPPPQPEAAVEIEKYDGNLIMKTLRKTFDEIYFIWGNHDFRLAKKLGFKKTFTECIQFMFKELTEDEWKGIYVSDLDHMNYYPVKRGVNRIRVCHPSNYSDVPLAVPTKLAIKYSCGIATAHSHHCAIGAAPNGVDLLIELGGFFDKNRTEYIQRTTNNHEWVQGFTMFKDGLPTLVSPILGNEREYRKEVK